MRTEQGIHSIRRFGEEGFSLVELLIVIGLMAIMMAIAITGLRSQLPKVHLNGTARDIAGRLMMARLKSVQNNAAYGLTFTPGVGGSYYPVLNNLGSSSSCGFGTWSPDPNSAGSQATPDVKIVVSGPCTNNRIEFYQNGTTCGCDTIILTSSDARVMTVTVDQTTGHVQVQ